MMGVSWRFLDSLDSAEPWVVGYFVARALCQWGDRCIIQDECRLGIDDSRSSGGPTTWRTVCLVLREIVRVTHRRVFDSRRGFSLFTLVATFTRAVFLWKVFGRLRDTRAVWRFSNAEQQNRLTRINRLVRVVTRSFLVYEILL
jgi:hypothetical protein